MLGRMRRRRISDDSTDVEGPCSGGTFCTETETESGTEHGQETRHEEPVAFSECSSTYTGVTPLGEASEVSSDMSLSPPLIKGALLRKMQRTEPVVLLDRIKTTKSVTPWSQSSLQFLSELQGEHLVVSIPLWMVSSCSGMVVTSQSASSADETSTGVRECLVQHLRGGVEEDEWMSDGSSMLQREECDSEGIIRTEMVTVNQDGASDDWEEPVITTLSACTNREIPVQALIVPECSYLGADDKDCQLPIERVMAPSGSPGPPPSDHLPLCPGAPVSQPEQNNVEAKRWKGKRRNTTSVLGESECGVEGQSSNEHGQLLASPQCESELAQESIPEDPESAAMDTASRLEWPCAANHLQGGGCPSPNLPQSTVRQEPSCSSNHPKVEPITDRPAEVGLSIGEPGIQVKQEAFHSSNGEPGIQVKQEAFHSNFKSNERYTFDVPLESPDCARLVPIVYHLQKPSSLLLLQQKKDRKKAIAKEKRRQAKEDQCNQENSESNHAHTLLHGEGSSGLNKLVIKQEPIFAGSCNLGEMVDLPQAMETSSPSASVSIATEETSPATQPALHFACLPPTPAEDLTLGTKDLSVQELLSKFTMGNNEADEEEKECTDGVLGASGIYTSTETSLPAEGDNNEALTWLENGDRTDISVGPEARDGSRVASSSSVGLDLLTPSTLDSLPNGMGMDSTRTVSGDLLLSSRGDHTAEYPLLAQQIQELEGVHALGSDDRTAVSKEGTREHDREDGNNSQSVRQKDDSEMDTTKGSQEQLKQVRKKLGTARKMGKDKTAVKLGRGKNMVNMAAASSQDALHSDVGVSESPSTWQNPKEIEDVPGDEGSGAFANVGSRDLNMESSRHIDSVGQKDSATADVMEENVTELQQVKKKKKKKVAGLRKIDKEQTAPVLLHGGKGKHPARKSSASSYNSCENLSESPKPAQKASKEMDSALAHEVSATFATDGKLEPHMDADIQPLPKDVTASDRMEESCTELQPGKKKVGLQKKNDKSPPVSPVHMVREQDGIIQSRKRPRNTNELASPAKRSRKSSPLSPEKEAPPTSEDSGSTSPARVERQSPKMPKKHSTKLPAAEGIKGECGSPDQPTCSQDTPGTVTLTDPHNCVPVPDSRPVTVPVTEEGPPIQGRKRGRKIKLQPAKKVAQHLPSKKLLEANNAKSSQPVHEAVPVAEGAQEGPSSSAHVRQGSNPTVDEPFTFNLEKNQERLCGSLKLQAGTARDTAWPQNSTPLSFSFLLPESKANAADATSRPDGTWVSNSDSPPPPLPQTPSSSISSYQPTPAGSSGDLAIDAEGCFVRKPEEGDLLELHPLGDFDDVSLLDDDPRGPAGDLAGRLSRAIKTAPKTDRPAHLRVPQNMVSVRKGQVASCLPVQTAPQREVSQRVRDWVEGISREPPLPPPQQVLKMEPLRPEDDEDFVSASIVNGPAVMLNYSEFPTRPSSNQHGPPAAPEHRSRGSSSDIPPSNSFRRWKGFCRCFLLNVPCLHKSCNYIHERRAELPSEVMRHLAMVERVGHLVDRPKHYLTDDVVVLLDHILQAFHNGDLRAVWTIKRGLDKTRIHLSCHFYEGFLNAAAGCKVLPDDLMQLARQSFFHLRNATVQRMEAHRKLDFENIICCHLKRNEIQCVCECLAMMSEGRLMPQVETIELFIVGVERAYAADPEANTHLVKRALHRAVEYVHHMPNVMNQFFPIVLKAPQVFVAEVRTLLQCVMENNLYALELENIVPVIDLCLCHSWAVELEHITSHCCFINLLPADTIQAVLRAVSTGRIPVSIGCHFVAKLSEQQRNHVDPQTWVGLLEHFCQYGKASMVVKVQKICKELQLTVPDMVLWEVLNYFVRVHNVSAAAEVFFQLKEVSPAFFNARCVNSIFKTLKETKDYVTLYRMLKKLLEHKMTEHLLELIPVFQWLLDNSLVKELACIITLIHSCRGSIRLPPRPFLEQAERKLIEWGKSDEVLTMIGELLGRQRPIAAVAPQEDVPPPPSVPLQPPSVPPPPPSAPRPPHVTSLVTAVVPNAFPNTHINNERLGLIEGILSEGEWDVAALMISRNKTVPVQLVQVVFRALVQLTGNTAKLINSLTRFIEGLLLSQCPTSSTQESTGPALRELIAQIGLSLVLHCCSTSQWTSGYNTLECLRSTGIHYISCVPVRAPTTEIYSSEGSRMMAAAKICQEVRPSAAIDIFRCCNWRPLEANDEEGIRLARSVIPNLVQHHVENGECTSAQEMLDHTTQYLGEAAEELYCMLFVKLLSAQELEKACNVAIVLLKQWKRVHKVKLVELLICLRSTNMMEKKAELLHLAIEAGVLQKIGQGEAQNDGKVVKGMTKEETALLLEQHLEDLCLLHIRLRDVSLSFPDIDSLHNSIDYVSNFPTPPLQDCKINDFLSPPTVTFPASTIVAWRGANINKSLWGSKGYQRQQNFRSPPTPKKQQTNGGKGKERMPQQGPGQPNYWPNLSPPSHSSQTVPNQSNPLQSSTEVPVTFTTAGKNAGPSAELSPSSHNLKMMTGQSPPALVSQKCSSMPHQQSAHTMGTNIVALKTQWRTAVLKEVHAIVQPFKHTKFPSRDDRQYFEQAVAQKFYKMVEKREPGPPWELTPARRSALKDYMGRILGLFDVYTPNIADSLNL